MEMCQFIIYNGCIWEIEQCMPEYLNVLTLVKVL